MKLIPKLLFLLTLNALVSPVVHAFLPPGKIEVMEIPEKKFYAIELRGVIAYPLASEMEEALAKIPKDSKIIIFLNSPGGSSSEGMKIIQTLRSEIAQGRNIHTHVRNGELCSSMCVPVFVQGKTRRAGEMAMFMFHGSYQAAFTNIPDSQMTELLLNTFYDAGVNREWVDSLKAQGVFSTPGEYYVSGKELMDTKSGVVTEIVSRHIRFEPWRAPIDPNIRSR